MPHLIDIEEEITGASDDPTVAPSLSEIRRSERPKRPTEKIREAQERVQQSNSIFTPPQPPQSSILETNRPQSKHTKKKQPRQKAAWEKEFSSKRNKDQKWKILRPKLAAFTAQPFPDPLQLPHRLPSIHLPAGVSVENPVSIFSLFITKDHCTTIAYHTNLNAKFQLEKQ